MPIGYTSADTDEDGDDDADNLYSSIKRIKVNKINCDCQIFSQMIK